MKTKRTTMKQMKTGKRKEAEARRNKKGRIERVGGEGRRKRGGREADVEKQVQDVGSLRKDRVSFVRS